MSGAVQLAAAKRLRTARAELDAQRLTDAVLRTQGAAGKKGEKGDTGPMPEHEWQGTKLRFEKPGGKWGEYVDLRGPKGARGTNGAPGQGGGGDVGSVFERFDLSALPPASSAAPDEIIVRHGDAWARASFAQMQGWLPGGGSSEGAGLRLVAHTNISGHRAVMATPLGAEHADPANAGAVIGISRHAAVAGDLVGIAAQGPLSEPTWAWTPGAPVFFVADGLLTQTVPTAVSVMPIGTALTPTSILINPLHAVFIGA